MGQAPGRLQTILPWRVRSPNLACKMRQRHAARVQRPHGQIPEAIRPDSEDTLAHPDGHTAESPRTRSRNSGRQLCNHGVRCRYRTVALWLSETIAGRTLPAGSHEPTDPDNIHVTKSPGTLPPRRARRVRSVKVPRPSSTTAARQNIHTSKSLHGLFRHNPDEHSCVQIAGVHAHEYDPAHCQASAADSFRAQPETAA